MTGVVPAARVDTRHPQYQELKSRVHQGLLNRLNLERLTRVRREDAEPEIRGVITEMLDAESIQIPLSLFERQVAGRRRPERVVRPGPASRNCWRIPRSRTSS